MAELNQRVPEVGDIIECKFGGTEMKYIACKIDGEGFTLVPINGIFAGRIYKGNRYESLEELYKALNDNVAMFTMQGSTWEIITGKKEPVQ